MIELTREQGNAVATQAESPIRVLDPGTHTKYVLLREEVYERVKMVFETNDDSEFVRNMTPHVMEVFGRDGWDDPAMDVYNKLDPRIEP